MSLFTTIFFYPALWELKRPHCVPCNMQPTIVGETTRFPIDHKTYSGHKYLELQMPCASASAAETHPATVAPQWMDCVDPSAEIVRDHTSLEDHLTARF